MLTEFEKTMLELIDELDKTLDWNLCDDVCKRDTCGNCHIHELRSRISHVVSQSEKKKRQTEENPVKSQTFSDVSVETTRKNNMFDMNVCVKGDKILTRYGHTLVYDRKSVSCVGDEVHFVRYPSGAYGTRNKDGSWELGREHNIDIVALDTNFIEAHKAVLWQETSK